MYVSRCQLFFFGWDDPLERGGRGRMGADVV